MCCLCEFAVTVNTIHTAQCAVYSDDPTTNPQRIEAVEFDRVRCEATQFAAAATNRIPLSLGETRARGNHLAYSPLGVAVSPSSEYQ